MNFHFPRPSILRPHTISLALLGVLALSQAPTVARAQGEAKLTTLYRFTDSSNGNSPYGTLTQGSDGNLYGTTGFGGTSSGSGTVFKVTPAGVLTTLYDFTGEQDGAEPADGLVQGGDGNFYGTTGFGGTSSNFGTVFKITPAGVLTTLYDFTGGEDGANPNPLALGLDGNFYGTTTTGGKMEQGTVFKITSAGVLTTLYRFAGGNDGGEPMPKLVQASDGNLYGATTRGGSNGGGTVFRITPAGVLTTIHQFVGDVEGSNPFGGLVQGSDGNLYGANALGGTADKGTVFVMTPAGVLTVLHNFGESADDGSVPEGGLIQGGDGNFYGTTRQGGFANAGTLFQVTPAGALTILYSFDFEDDTGGDSPIGGLVLASDGNFYGTTASGGADDGGGGGTIFKLSVTDHPAFFAGQAAVGDGQYYLGFAGGNFFGYYSFLDVPGDPNYLAHADLGYEYVFDANDGKSGVYLYDFASRTFFYTSPTFPFPYLYDFSLNSVVYYFPDPNNPGHYNTDGIRYFYDFATGQIISK